MLCVEDEARGELMAMKTVELRCLQRALLPLDCGANLFSAHSMKIVPR